MNTTDPPPSWFRGYRRHLKASDTFIATDAANRARTTNFDKNFVDALLANTHAPPVERSYEQKPRRLATGYVSQEVFLVRKNETPKAPRHQPSDTLSSITMP